MCLIGMKDSCSRCLFWRELSNNRRVGNKSAFDRINNAMSIDI